VGAAGVAAALGAVPNPPAAALGAVPNPPAAGGNNVKRASHANRLMVGCMQWLCMRMLCLRVLSMCVGGGVRGVSVCVCVCVRACVCVCLAVPVNLYSCWGMWNAIGVNVQITWPLSWKTYRGTV